VLAAALVAIALLPDDTPALGILAFGLAGLGCSALLPLTISVGQAQLVGSASVAGGVIACYQLGYGIAAFGAGPLQDAGVGLPALYGFTAVAAVVMGGLSFVLAPRQPAPSSTRV
jgi:predicted MFS family arabinose efflux permease